MSRSSQFLSAPFKRRRLYVDDYVLHHAGICRPRIYPSSVQRRRLLTAVTASPSLLENSKSASSTPSFVATIVDAAITWASQKHKSTDPPSHAIVLINKTLLPEGKDQLAQALSESSKLSGLDALVGAVDSVGEGAKGVSVLLASCSESATIHTLRGPETDELRVGRWHAKDVEEEEELIDFKDVLAKIRGESKVQPAIVTTNPLGRGFVFALGEMEAVNRQAGAINQMFPSADIVLDLQSSLTEAGNHTGTDSYYQHVIYDLNA